MPMMRRARIEATGEQKIKAGGWVPCWICEEVFRRKRETARFCNKCKRGFCEGEHGNFAYGVGTCVVCGARKVDRR